MSMKDDIKRLAEAWRAVAEDAETRAGVLEEMMDLAAQWDGMGVPPPSPSVDLPLDGFFRLGRAMPPLLDDDEPARLPDMQAAAAAWKRYVDLSTARDGAPSARSPEGRGDAKSEEAALWRAGSMIPKRLTDFAAEAKAEGDASFLRMLAGWDGWMPAQDVFDRCGMPERTRQKRISDLTDRGLIERKGPERGPASSRWWRLSDEGRVVLNELDGSAAPEPSSEEPKPEDPPPAAPEPMSPPEEQDPGARSSGTPPDTPEQAARAREEGQTVALPADQGSVALDTSMVLKATADARDALMKLEGAPAAAAAARIERAATREPTTAKAVADKLIGEGLGPQGKKSLARHALGDVRPPAGGRVLGPIRPDQPDYRPNPTKAHLREGIRAILVDGPLSTAGVVLALRGRFEIETARVARELRELGDGEATVFDESKRTWSWPSAVTDRENAGRRHTA